MRTSKLVVNRANFVLVFDNLRTARISRDRLREAIPDSEPEYFDVGEIIVVRYPALRLETIITVDSRRIECKVDGPDDETLQSVPRLSHLARSAVENAKLIAYGFNFFAEAELAEGGNANTFLLDQFEPALRNVERQLGGQLSGIATRLDYAVNGIAHQLNLQPNPIVGTTMDISLNIHHETGVMPEEANLITSYIQCRDRFLATMNRLFERH